MNKKGATVGVLLILFLGVIVALAIVPEIARNTQELTARNSVVNETISLASARFGGATGGAINDTYPIYVTNRPTGWKLSECPITGFVIRNQTGKVGVITTDYLVDLAIGAVYIKNLTNFNTTVGAAANLSAVDYNFCQDGYIPQSGGRAVANLILIFSALGLAGFVIYYAVKNWIK